MKFRDLNKDEIECRVATVNEKDALFYYIRMQGAT